MPYVEARNIRLLDYPNKNMLNKRSEILSLAITRINIDSKH